MSSTFDQCSLYLCPVEHDFRSKEFSLFIDRLQTIGFISQQITPQSADTYYLTGNRFLEYIAYMGCSPAIQFEADEDNKNFCHIKIHQYESAQLIVSDKQARAPHCPNCSQSVKNWQTKQSDSSILCDRCNTKSTIEKFDWRKMAGYAQLFIEVTDIFPKEAIPQQLLLNNLSDITDVDWQYFYSCQ